MAFAGLLYRGDMAGELANLKHITALQTWCQYNKETDHLVNDFLKVVFSSVVTAMKMSVDFRLQ